MAVTVKLPTILRKHAGGEAKVGADGATLRDVLSDLEGRYPGITKNVARRGRRPAPVHQRLRERRGRALPGLARDRGGRRRHGLDPARRRRRLAGVTLLEGLAEYARRALLDLGSSIVRRVRRRRWRPRLEVAPCAALKPYRRSGEERTPRPGRRGVPDGGQVAVDPNHRHGCTVRGANGAEASRRR